MLINARKKGEKISGKFSCVGSFLASLSQFFTDSMVTKAFFLFKGTLIKFGHFYIRTSFLSCK